MRGTRYWPGTGPAASSARGWLGTPSPSEPPRYTSAGAESSLERRERLRPSDYAFASPSTQRLYGPISALSPRHAGPLVTPDETPGQAAADGWAGAGGSGEVAGSAPEPESRGVRRPPRDGRRELKHPGPREV